MKKKSFITGLNLLIALFVLKGIASAQDIVIGDTVLIKKKMIISDIACLDITDTIKIKKQNDEKIINRTWYFDHFFTTLNDSITFVIEYGIDKVYMKFSEDWAINASGECYGFMGSYRISKDNRLLIKSAGSKAIYCKKDTLNFAYQAFWGSLVPLLHEANYRVCEDSLVLMFQTGCALLIDGSNVSNDYFNKKKWPIDNGDNKDFYKAIDSLFNK